MKRGETQKAKSSVMLESCAHLWKMILGKQAGHKPHQDLFLNSKDNK